MKTALAYIRVSGKGQIKGTGLESQKAKILTYCKNKKINLVQVFQEKGISGAIENRPDLMKMLVELELNSYDCIIIDRYDRLARDLMVQENIIHDIQKLNTELISVEEGNISTQDNYTRKMIRQILGAISEYDKQKTVARLRLAREIKKRKTGKCEGAKLTKELKPDVWKEIKKLTRKPKCKPRLKQKEIVKILNSKGYTTATGKIFTVSNLNSLIHLEKIRKKSHEKRT